MNFPQVPSTIAGVRLRRLNGRDLAGVEQHLLDLDPVSRNRRFNSGFGDAAVRAYVRHLDLKSDILFGAVEIGSGRIVGLAEAHPAERPQTVEIGASVLATYRGYGMARELIRRAIDVAFSRGAVAAELRFDQSNPAVTRIATGLGAEFNAFGRAVVRVRAAMTSPQQNASPKSTGAHQMNAIESGAENPWQNLFERLIGEWDERQSPEWDSRETRLASSVYTDPQRYQAELSGLFRRLPLCLGHVSQLAGSDNVLAREIAGLPLLLTRDPTGAIAVLLNACRHRGARLAGGEETVCQRATLSCRYHGWTYGLDGSLVGVPRREAFPTLDPRTHGLRQLPSAVRHGLIWAVLDPDSTVMPDIAAHLGGLDGDLAALGMARHQFFRQNAVVRKANWKLIIDAFIEFYHVKRLHASTIGQYLADAKAVADRVGPHQRILVARDNFAEVRQLAPRQWSPQRHGTLEHFIFPNSLIVFHPDYISHMGIFPVAIDRTLFVHSLLTPDAPVDAKAAAHWTRSFELMDAQVFNGEDLFICEQIQLGLAAVANGSFVLGRFENNVRRFHETVDAALNAV